jgi:hypothetical protein
MTRSLPSLTIFVHDILMLSIVWTFYFVVVSVCEHSTNSLNLKKYGENKTNAQIANSPQAIESTIFV